jgi:shikimate dehydrogenase
VLGSPIGHSLSPALHRAAYAGLGLDWDYHAVECDEEALPGVLARVRSEPGWAGLSLTMPLKTVAVGLLDRVDASAELLGAVNTVVVAPDGGLAGFNTDVDGIGYAVARVARTAPTQPLILGAGGTARAAVAALARAGAARVGVVARRPEAVRTLTDVGDRLGLVVTPLPWDILAGGLPSGPDLVISTTPAGATDALAEHGWPGSCALVELLYYPWPTRLAARAYRAGAQVAGGLAILAGQAVGQVTHFTGRRVEVGVLLAAGSAALACRRTPASVAVGR